MFLPDLERTCIIGIHHGLAKVTNIFEELKEVGKTQKTQVDVLKEEIKTSIRRWADF
jgi:hypothetical protein